MNPYQMKKYGDVEIHKAKTDKKDALRIARFALEKSYCLTLYSSMEQKYEDLKFLSRQYNQRVSLVTKIKVQLLNILDETMPGITKILALRSKELHFFYLLNGSNLLMKSIRWGKAVFSPHTLR